MLLTGNKSGRENKNASTKITCEKTNRRHHQYRVGHQILIKTRKHSKHYLEYEGPYAITQVNDNGTIRFQKGIGNDVVNIRRIKPFYG